jgi:heme exporter protein A
MTLTLADLTCGRGGWPVVAGVSLTVAPGQAVMLTGPNGAGKTTLLRTVAGLLPPLAGRIEGAEERIALAGHADAVKPTQTVAENLAFWAALHGARDIGQALAAFDLAALADRPGRELSAGQRRRAGLARLMVTGRPVWLMDEPTVSLDAASVARLEAVLRAHLAGGGLALVASHLPLAGTVGFDLSPFRAAPPADPFAGVAA